MCSAAHFQEQPNDTLVTLTRSHKGEEVVVELHVNAQPSMEFEELEGEEDAAQRVMFNVSVVKGDTALVFECESDGTYVGINHVSYEPKDGFESDSYYTGPVFDELDEQLQGAFGEYLEERGITPELGEYLRHVIYDKEEREYSSWLENVAKFVGK